MHIILIQLLSNLAVKTFATRKDEYAWGYKINRHFLPCIVKICYQTYSILFVITKYCENYKISTVFFSVLHRNKLVCINDKHCSSHCTSNLTNKGDVKYISLFKVARLHRSNLIFRKKSKHYYAYNFEY